MHELKLTFRTFLDDPGRAAETAHTTVDGDHGRIETRTSLVSRDISWLQEQHAWPGLSAIGKVVRTREKGAELSTETAYYLLSTALSAARFGEVARWIILRLPPKRCRLGCCICIY